MDGQPHISRPAGEPMERIMRLTLEETHRDIYVYICSLYCPSPSDLLRLSAAAMLMITTDRIMLMMMSHSAGLWEWKLDRRMKTNLGC